MLIKVKDTKGNVYTSDMSENNDKTIIEMHFCTSYTQVIVQDKIINEEGKTIYPDKNVIIPLDGGSWVDMIAVNDDEIGEWV